MLFGLKQHSSQQWWSLRSLGDMKADSLRAEGCMICPLLSTQARWPPGWLCVWARVIPHDRAVLTSCSWPVAGWRAVWDLHHISFTCKFCCCITRRVIETIKGFEQRNVLHCREMAGLITFFWVCCYRKIINVMVPPWRWLFSVVPICGCGVGN